MIDNNVFEQSKMQNFVSVTQGKQIVNFTANFFYLSQEKESSGYEIYRSGGFLGFTPSSWKNDMGLFNMFKHVPQGSKDLQLALYQVKHVVGLELH